MYRTVVRDVYPSSVRTRPSPVPAVPHGATTADQDAIPLVVRRDHQPPARGLITLNTQGHGYNKLFTQVCCSIMLLVGIANSVADRMVTEQSRVLFLEL